MLAPRVPLAPGAVAALDRAPAVGVPVRAHVVLGGLPGGAERILALAPARGLAVDATRFDSHEPIAPGTRFLPGYPPAFALVALAPGAHELSATISTAGSADTYPAPAPPRGRPRTRATFLEQRRVAFDVAITPARSGEVPVTAAFRPYYCGVDRCLVAAPVTLRWTAPVAP